MSGDFHFCQETQTGYQSIAENEHFLFEWLLTFSVPPNKPLKSIVGLIFNVVVSFLRANHWLLYPNEYIPDTTTFSTVPNINPTNF